MPPEDDMPFETGRWRSISDTAADVGVSPKTVRRWITEQRIEARRFGPKLIRVDMNSVIAMAVPVIPPRPDAASKSSAE